MESCGENSNVVGARPTEYYWHCSLGRHKFTVFKEGGKVFVKQSELLDRKGVNGGVHTRDGICKSMHDLFHRSSQAIGEVPRMELDSSKAKYLEVTDKLIEVVAKRECKGASTPPEDGFNSLGVPDTSKRPRVGTSPTPALLV